MTKPEVAIAAPGFLLCADGLVVMRDLMECGAFGPLIGQELIACDWIEQA
ncbi:MAG: hypothetical protein ACI89J_003722 [Hyphomicrobiaceae bacterium]